ncbi:hypothetical protein [Bifidobacterium sp.]|uniref:hypothetical protein n=1 Tax=Bifidobacterium sp. TaxID=41200 RepID=UPI0039E79F06
MIERKIIDIREVKPGDMAKIRGCEGLYEVLSANRTDPVTKLGVDFSFISQKYVFVRDSEFEYAIRDIKVPTEPGIYRDCIGDEWALFNDGTVVQLRRYEDSIESFAGCGRLPTSRAPYTRVDCSHE